MKRGHKTISALFDLLPKLAEIRFFWVKFLIATFPIFRLILDPSHVLIATKL